MTNRNKYCLYLLIFITLFGCESDYNLNIPDFGRKIVINGFLSTEDTITVQISESKFILDSIKFYKPLKNPKVQLWIDDQYTEDLHCRYSQSFYSQYRIDSLTYVSAQKPIPGKTYSIKVLAPGLPEATATVKMPETVPIDKIDTILTVNRVSKLYSIFFNDPGEEPNYYFLKFFGTHLVLNGNCDTSVYISEWDFKPEFPYNDKFIFSDKLFNGREAEVRFLIPYRIPNMIYNPSSSYDCSQRVIDEISWRKMYIKLYCCSEEFYLYYKSFRTIIERGDDVFYEPVKVFSNVKNGYGVLTAYNTYIDSILIKVRSFTPGVRY